MPSISTFPPEHYLSDPFQAIDVLATHLTRGELALFLGAGVSRGLGLPNWWQLVKKCAENTAGISSEDINNTTPNDSLLKRIDDIKESTLHSKYLEIVKNALYQDRPSDINIITQELLIAIGALITPSQKGYISEVVTYNYDDILEWYLYVHGFSFSSIHNPENLIGRKDVNIFHPHGYLPQKFGNNSDVIVFSKTEYDDRLGSNPTPWINAIESLLTTKIPIFVGLSGDDITFGPMLRAVYKRTERQLGFWIFREAYDESDQSIVEKYKTIIRYNAIPIFLGNQKKLPEFLLEICQKASSINSAPTS